MVDLAPLALFDPNAHQFIVGEARIAAEAGYKDPRYFAETVMRDVCSRSIVGCGIPEPVHGLWPLLRVPRADDYPPEFGTDLGSAAPGGRPCRAAGRDQWLAWAPDPAQSQPDQQSFVEGQPLTIMPHWSRRTVPMMVTFAVGPVTASRSAVALSTQNTSPGT